MKRSRFSLLLFTFVSLATLVLSGCSSVQPYQRAAFATYEMKPDRDPLATAMAEHIYFSREAATGGRGVGGSGCGCN